jgi:hypothetical protein
MDDYLEKAVEPPVPSTNGAGEKDRSSRRRDLEERGSKRPRSGEDGKEKVREKDEGRDRDFRYEFVCSPPLVLSLAEYLRG